MNRNFIYYYIKTIDVICYMLMFLVTYGFISGKLYSATISIIYIIILAYCSIKLDEEGKKWKEK